VFQQQQGFESGEDTASCVSWQNKTVQAGTNLEMARKIIGALLPWGCFVLGVERASNSLSGLSFLALLSCHWVNPTALGL
jgi:hypothetical protein